MVGGGRGGGGGGQNPSLITGNLILYGVWGGIEMPVCVLKAAGDVQHDPDSDSTCLLFVSFLSCGVLSHTNTAGEM